MSSVNKKQTAKNDQIFVSTHFTISDFTQGSKPFPYNVCFSKMSEPA